MAYFPNGTSGMMYQEKWCERCVHWPDEPKFDGEYKDVLCAVWSVHLLCDYKGHEEALDELIPMDKGMWPTKCRMFIERPNDG